MLRAIQEFFRTYGIPPSRIAVAASGGTDSTALLAALAALGEHELVALHVNHHLRGADADADEAFVRELAQTLRVDVHVADGTLDERRVRDRGIEAAAREVRYQRLLEMRERSGARFVATAHQKDDQAETVLMRVLTGSGIAGLRGIHPMREDGFIRPLLDVTRAEIEAFLRERGITPRFDRSNDDPRFLRNRVRVLLRELGASANLAAVAAQARALWPLLERAIDEAEREHADVHEHETRFVSKPDDPWLAGALLQRHIRRLDPGARDFDAERIAAEWDAIRRASVTKELEVVRDGEALILRRPPEPAEAFEVELTPEKPGEIPGGRVYLRKTDRADVGARQVIQLPHNASPTFRLRSRLPGDRFHPLGMPAPKKLKDFLIDRKIAAEERDRLPLLIWNGEIVWVAGVEVSERFKVTSPRGGDLYEVWMEGSGASDDRDQSRLQR